MKMTTQMIDDTGSEGAGSMGQSGVCFYSSLPVPFFPFSHFTFSFPLSFSLCLSFPLSFSLQPSHASYGTSFVESSPSNSFFSGSDFVEIRETVPEGEDSLVFEKFAFLN